MLTAERVREVLDYNPDTGALTWRTTTSNRAVAGTLAGYARKDGRRAVMVDKRMYWAHRLAWLHVTGEWPRGMVDHIDGDNKNNAIANLRDVNNSVNQQNRRRAQSNNRLGLLGVKKNGPGFSATIKAGGRKIHLGTWPTPGEAHAAYLAAKRRLHEGCNI